MNKNKIYLSVVAPAYNEEKRIEAVLSSWVEHLEKIEPNYEIIICDDGSTDHTWRIIETLAKTNKKIKNLHFMSNQGAGAAHAMALKYSSGEWILMIDSDGQYDILDYLVMKEKQRQTGADAIIGIRGVKQDSFFLRAGSYLSSIAANLLLKSDIRDFNSVFKLIRGEIGRRLPLDARKFEVSTDSTAKLLEHNAKIAEVEVTHNKKETKTPIIKFPRLAFNRFAFILYLYIRKKLIKKKILDAEQFNRDITVGCNWDSFLKK